MSGRAHNLAAAWKYGRGVTHQGNSGHLSRAGGITITSTLVPPIEVFEAWFADKAKARATGHKATVDARVLRRIAAGHLSGSSDTEIARAVGFSTGCVIRWLAQLPVELGGRAHDTAPVQS